MTNVQLMKAINIINVAAYLAILHTIVLFLATPAIKRLIRAIIYGLLDKIIIIIIQNICLNTNLLNCYLFQNFPSFPFLPPSALRLWAITSVYTRLLDLSYKRFQAEDVRLPADTKLHSRSDKIVNPF